MARVAINGFGRIGRQSFKAIIEHYPDDLEIVAINDLADPTILAHLLKYDSTYGAFEGQIQASDGELSVSFTDSDGDQRTLRIAIYAESNPMDLPWRELGIDLVIEATGGFTDADLARIHLRAGAKKVLITAPARGEDITICLGVNDERYDHGVHHIISNASSTTNCLAPVAKILNDRFGIRRGMLTTIHSYTMDQSLQDNVHDDLRRARAAGVNLVPTTTGAARAVGLVIPELRGLLEGFAVRVPTPTVSLIDFVVELDRPASIEHVNQAFREAAASEELEGILGVSDDALVSSDYIGTTYSAVVDLALTMSLGEDLFKIVAWYDNEWGYASRVADVAAYVAEGFEE